MVRLTSIALAGTAVLFLTACGHSSADPSEAAAAVSPASSPAANTPDVVTLGANAPELKQMTIEPVRTVAVPADEVVAPARIEANPNRVGHASLPAAGRILHVMVKLGDSVVQGQPLISIESPSIAEAEAAFVQGEASVRQAEVSIAKADADLSRITDLFENQAVAKKEVLAAQTAAALAGTSLEQARSAREQARRKLELLGLKPGRSEQHVTVAAPISGKVLEIGVVEGEYRNEINTPLITIADLSRVWASSDVPESAIRFCKVGGTATLELIAYPNETFRARVTRIADTVNAETRTIKVNAELENAGGRLRPEMFGQLRYTAGTADLPWVPSSALIRMGEQDIVFLQQSPGRFLARPVKTGRSFNGGYPVVSGLQAGDHVVTQGSVYLKAAL